MGMRKLGFGQTIGVSGEESARQAEQAKRAAARKASGYDDGQFNRLPFGFLQARG